MLVSVLFKLTLSTGIPVTVTVHLASFCPSSLITFTTVVPTAFAVTFPWSSTLATLAWLLLQFNFVLVALLGLIVATNFSLLPN